MIAFLAISGNKCCHGNTFSCFLGFSIFWGGSLHSKPLHGLELISFLTITGNTFFLFLGLIYGLFAFPTPAQTGAD